MSADNKFEDKELGVSVRFIATWDPNHRYTEDRAMLLAMQDDRDMPFLAKLNDALKFIRLNTH